MFNSAPKRHKNPHNKTQIEALHWFHLVIFKWMGLQRGLFYDLLAKLLFFIETTKF